MIALIASAVSESKPLALFHVCLFFLDRSPPRRWRGAAKGAAASPPKSSKTTGIIAEPRV